MLLQKMTVISRQRTGVLVPSSNYYLFVCYNVALENPKSWNSEFTAMAKGHTYFWRKPGRRDEERKQFAALMRKLEAVRLAAELETTTGALRNWMTGRAIGRRETVAKINDFLRRNRGNP
jgi:hypothetical protein